MWLYEWSKPCPLPQVSFGHGVYYQEQKSRRINDYPLKVILNSNIRWCQWSSFPHWLFHSSGNSNNLGSPVHFRLHFQASHSGLSEPPFWDSSETQLHSLSTEEASSTPSFISLDEPHGWRCQVLLIVRAGNWLFPDFQWHWLPTVDDFLHCLGFSSFLLTSRKHSWLESCLRLPLPSFHLALGFS